MIWLTWRQFRAPALAAGIALAALAVYLLVEGLQIRQDYDEFIVNGAGVAADVLSQRHGSQLALVGTLLLVAPALLGAFLGAPLVARELETGTHRLVWTQGVTRMRWLTVKLAVTVLASAAVTGALSVLLTWAASPYDRLVGERFDPMFFGARNIAPLGYAVFAVVAGIAIGLLIRRTVPAMAVTLAVFAALQFVMPAMVRPHLQTPVTATIALDGQSMTGISIGADGIRVHGLGYPGAWVLTPEGLLVDRAGQPITRAEVDACTEGTDLDKTFDCLEDRGLQVQMTYHPAESYWTFQWLEFAIFLGLAGLLAGLAFWRIRKS